MVKQTFSHLARWRNKSVLALAIACCLTLFMAIAAFASNVYISDQANVLDKSQVQNAAQNLNYPVSIYTTNNYTGSQQQFESETASKINSSNMIVMAIDTKDRFVVITGGTGVPLSNNQYQDAYQSFKSGYSSGGYTSATVSALQTLQSDLSSGGSSSNSGSGSGSTSSSSSGSGFGIGSSALCCVGLLVIVGIAVFAFTRRRRFGRFGMNNGYPMQGPGYPPNYNQGYPPNYGNGYNQGVNPIIPGGIGAVGGGLLGYELGKEQGERDERREDGGNFGGGAGGFFGGDNNNNGGGFGGDNNAGGGAGGFFGGGNDNNGGSNFGGGSFGGNDFGGGGGNFGGGDFGGGGGGFGGGGDAGGGAGGSF